MSAIYCDYCYCCGAGALAIARGVAAVGGAALAAESAPEELSWVTVVIFGVRC